MWKECIPSKSEHNVRRQPRLCSGGPFLIFFFLWCGGCHDAVPRIPFGKEAHISPAARSISCGRLPGILAVEGSQLSLSLGTALSGQKLPHSRSLHFTGTAHFQDYGYMAVERSVILPLFGGNFEGHYCTRISTRLTEASDMTATMSTIPFSKF